tara:strand:- start:211 stop:519 length:309 start_codon:yes stop_codon:yes gene_type:complete
MKEGFTYLETGKYKQAETFFENILITYPKNKTAKLCYGRAIGLNGNGKRASTIFINLLERYPQDLKLNLIMQSLYYGMRIITKQRTIIKTYLRKTRTAFLLF